MLLWVLILALFGAMVAWFGRNLPPTLRARVLAVQGMIGVGFLAFILFTSNHFLRVDPPPLDGNDLNPLLQDPGQLGRAHAELQSLMRTSYAVFCLKKQKTDVGITTHA